MSEIETNVILTLSINRVVRPRALHLVASWYEDTPLFLTSLDFPFSSQRSSEFLPELGESSAPMGIGISDHIRPGEAGALCAGPSTRAEICADNRSFGFRLFRSAQDAAHYASLCLHHRHSASWILEGDIRGCFDNISDDWLKANIPLERPILTQSLKAGFVFEQTLYPTDRGTPQGGLLSPILANMTLDGIEDSLTKLLPKMKAHFIRYADDFLATAPSKEIAEDIREHVRKFLAERGLELSIETCGHAYR